MSKVFSLIALIGFSFLIMPLIVNGESLSAVFNEICWPVKSAYAANGLKMETVIINEVAWMGTEKSSNDEWIELYNNSDSSINLEGWILKTADGTPKINLTGTISAKSFYLLERTDDDTVPSIPANQIYTGALGNNGENLELYDNFGNLVDSVNCANGWFAGNNKTKQTMERVNPAVSGNDSKNWQTSQISGGTPEAENSKVKIVEPSPALPSGAGEEKISESKPFPSSQEIPLEEKTTPAETKTETQVYPVGIIINEILPSPEGSDETEEWIELKNLNNEIINISGWQIQDTVGSIKTYTFPENTKIPAQGFLVVKRPDSKITLNNSGDGLKLFYLDGSLIDEMVYKKAPLNQSYNRTESGWVWSAFLTAGDENIVKKNAGAETLLPAPPSGAGRENQMPENKNEKTSPDSEIKLASVKEQLSKNSKSLAVFFNRLFSRSFCRSFNFSAEKES